MIYVYEDNWRINRLRVSAPPRLSALDSQKYSQKVKPHVVTNFESAHLLVLQYHKVFSAHRDKILSFLRVQTRSLPDNLGGFYL